MANENNKYEQPMEKTQEIFEWFKSIGNKQYYKFIMFEIKDFYLSILKEL